MINHNSRINPHKIKNQIKCTIISGNNNLSVMASGNSSTILPTRLNIRERTHPKITKNTTVGKIASNHVIK
jgi:hypothetical protein